MPRVKVYKQFTEKDQRFTTANKINNSNWKCPNSQPVAATKKGNVVTITCGCNFTASKIVGGIIDEYDAFAHFTDEHHDKV